MANIYVKKVMRAQISLFQIMHFYLSTLSSGTLLELNPIMKSNCARNYFSYSKYLTDFDTISTAG